MTMAWTNLGWWITYFGGCFTQLAFQKGCFKLLTPKMWGSTWWTGKSQTWCHLGILPNFPQLFPKLPPEEVFPPGLLAQLDSRSPPKSAVEICKNSDLRKRKSQGLIEMKIPSFGEFWEERHPIELLQHCRTGALSIPFHDSAWGSSLFFLWETPLGHILGLGWRSTKPSNENCQSGIRGGEGHMVMELTVVQKIWPSNLGFGW